MAYFRIVFRDMESHKPPLRHEDIAISEAVSPPRRSSGVPARARAFKDFAAHAQFRFEGTPSCFSS